MKSKIKDTNDPFFKYTIEEKREMTDDEFISLIEASNEYVSRKYSILKESPLPKFNTIEDCMRYFDAIPLEEAINNWNKLFEEHDNS